MSINQNVRSIKCLGVIKYQYLNNTNILLMVALSINQNVRSTRSDKVAEIMEINYRYHLRHLGDDHCWYLFEKWAFGSELPIIRM